MASSGVLPRGVSPFLVFLIAIITLGPLQFGLHLAELNAPHDAITCKPASSSSFSRVSAAISSLTTKPVVTDCIPMSSAAFATVSSIFTIGGLFGALTAGPFTSSKGRLPAMRVTAVFYSLGSVIITLASSVPVMSIGRFLTGVGAGASTVIVPLYISEAAPPALRGFFGAFTQISINVGILLTQTLGYFLSSPSTWRWIMSAGAFVAGAQALALLLVPESPAWLARNKGDMALARRTLQRIRGHGVNLDDEVASWGASEPAGEEQALLAQDTQTTPTRRPGFFEVAKDSNTRPAIAAVVGIQAAQQLCGINSIIMYSVSLLTGLLPINAALLAILISLANLVMTVACSPLPDKLGRKTCLLISIVGQGSSSLALALSILYGVKILSAVSVVLFVAFFAVGLGPVPFIMASELVDQEAVGATQSWSLGANYATTFLVAQFFPIINDALNARFGGAGWVYFIFTALAALFAVFVSWKVPETNGKKDADEVWGRTRRLD